MHSHRDISGIESSELKTENSNLCSTALAYILFVANVLVHSGHRDSALLLIIS